MWVKTVAPQVRQRRVMDAHSSKYMGMIDGFDPSPSRQVWKWWILPGKTGVQSKYRGTHSNFLSGNPNFLLLQPNYQWLDPLCRCLKSTSRLRIPPFFWGASFSDSHLQSFSVPGYADRPHTGLGSVLAAVRQDPSTRFLVLTRDVLMVSWQHQLTSGWWVPGVYLTKLV